VQSEERRDAEGTPGPGGHQPAFGGIDGGRGDMAKWGSGPRRVAGRAGRWWRLMTSAGRGERFHVVRLGNAGRLGRQTVSASPSAGVEYAHPSTVRPRPGAPACGSREQLHGVLRKGDRQIGFVRSPRRNCSPQRRLLQCASQRFCEGPGRQRSWLSRRSARWEEARISRVPRGDSNCAGPSPGAADLGVPGGRGCALRASRRRQFRDW